MKNKLKDYTEGKSNFTSILGILMNNQSKKWYTKLGKYIVDTLDAQKIPELKFYIDKLENQKTIITKMKDYFDSSERTYSSIAILFTTSILDEFSLKKMFGDPIFHNEFGEGFDGEWNEELEDYNEPEIEESYASYFVNIGGLDFHIGYDHRGTGIEIKIPVDVNYNVTDSDAEKCFEALKGLIDLYKTKC